LRGLVWPKRSASCAPQALRWATSIADHPARESIRNLKNAGFKVKKTTQTRTTGKDDVVLSQSPARETRAKTKSVVRIVNVALTPTPTRVAIALLVTLRAFPPRRTMTAVVAQATDPSTADPSVSQVPTRMT
jgi:beta-lactam-binding protein with PASTA domain